MNEIHIFWQAKAFEYDFDAKQICAKNQMRHGKS